MRKNLMKIILGITGMACLLFTYKPAVAEIYTQFQSVETRNWGGDFRLTPELQANFKVLNDGLNTGLNDFRLYRNPTVRPDSTLDDGYAEVPLGFTYRFNAKNYTKVYVSINGFVTFDVPPGNEAITRDPNCLFINDAGGAIPTNVIAPYWGDHKYWRNTVASRDSGKAASEIGYVNFKYEAVNPVTKDTTEKNAILIQWKNLNVNWCDRVKNADGTVADSTIYLGNVASFQLIIYEGADSVVAQQGNVEFRYGTFQPTEDQLSSPNGANIKSNPNNAASIGVKGDSRISSDKADFINALYCGFLSTTYPADANMQRNYQTLATFWQPSGDPGRAILLAAHHSVNGDENWGDGDADMSKAEGGRHYEGTVPQNRYVTMGDVRDIMLSTVTGRKLDSVYKQEAFHADVHHDGRFYYLTNRNSGIYRIDGNKNIITDNSLYLPSTDPSFNPMYDLDRVSRDTFCLRKVGNFEGKFGFKEYYGKNDDFIEIDFVDFGLPTSNSVRRFKVLDKANNMGDPDFDYQIRIAVINNADKALLWNVSESSVQSRIEVLRIKLKKNIAWRDSLLTQNISDLPGISNPYKEIYYQADELDASFIMAWLGGQIGWLPYIWDNPDHNKKGKITVSPYKVANNIAFNNEKVVNNNIVLPIYYNGVVDNNQSVKFNFNTDVINIEGANSNVLVEFSNDTKTAVIISDGHFNPNNPIAYVILADDVNIFEASNVRFYGEDVDNVSYKLVSDNVLGSNSLSNNPNPVTNYTNILVNIPVAGTYRLAVYDNSGNLISEIANSDFEVGTHNFIWDCAKVASGTYFYALESANSSVTKSLIIAK
jgi:hypothetical protein